VEAAIGPTRKPFDTTKDAKLGDKARACLLRNARRSLRACVRAPGTVVVSCAPLVSFEAFGTIYMECRSLPCAHARHDAITAFASVVIVTAIIACAGHHRWAQMERDIDQLTAFFTKGAELR
jgi:hypothetical protein